MHRHDSASFHASSPQVKAHNTSLRMRTQAKWWCVVSIPSPLPAQSARQYSIHSVAYRMRQSHKMEKQPSALFFQPAPGVVVRSPLSADGHYSTWTSLGKGLRKAQNQWDAISSDGPGIERKKRWKNAPPTYVSREDAVHRPGDLRLRVELKFWVQVRLFGSFISLNNC